MVDSSTTSRWWSRRVQFAYAMVAAYKALRCPGCRMPQITGPTSISVADMVSIMFIADGVNVPITWLCRVGISMISSRGFVESCWYQHTNRTLGYDGWTTFPRAVRRILPTALLVAAQSSKSRIGDEVCDSHHPYNTTNSTKHCASFTGLGTQSPAPPEEHISEWRVLLEHVCPILTCQMSKQNACPRVWVIRSSPSLISCEAW